jgi:hypothetical protein
MRSLRPVFAFFSLALVAGCGDKEMAKKENKPVHDSVNEFSCKLTPSALRERKETVLDLLKKQVLEKKELENGYTFKFSGSDSLYVQLTDLIRTERICCDFFTFRLEVAGERNFTWLTVTGPPGAKEFIKNEMGL